MTYKIMAVTPEEYAKSDTNPNYQVQEYIAGTIECEEWEIDHKLARAIKAGQFPAGSQYA